MGGSVPFLKFIFANGGLAGTVEDIHIYMLMAACVGPVRVGVINKT